MYISTQWWSQRGNNAHIFKVVELERGKWNFTPLTSSRLFFFGMDKYIKIYYFLICCPMHFIVKRYLFFLHLFVLYWVTYTITANIIRLDIPGNFLCALNLAIRCELRLCVHGRTFTLLMMTWMEYCLIRIHTTSSYIYMDTSQETFIWDEHLSWDPLYNPKLPSVPGTLVDF